MGYKYSTIFPLFTLNHSTFFSQKVAFPALKNGSAWSHFVSTPPYSCMKLHSLCLFLFVVGEELEKLGREAGFTVAKHYELGGGLMGNLVATR